MEEHACCRQGLCQEAAARKTYYWSELCRPHNRLRADLTQDADFWCFSYGDLKGYGKSPSDAADDFDRLWFAAATGVQ